MDERTGAGRTPGLRNDVVGRAARTPGSGNVVGRAACTPGAGNVVGRAACTPRAVCSKPRSRKRTALLLACLSAFAAAESPPLLHPLFADHAVLQRDRPLRLYGDSTPGARVTVELADHTTATRADRSGHWLLELPALPAGGPHILTARASDGRTQQLADVLIGDVWLCSGQSNMVLPVHRALDARAEIAGSADDRIRMLTIAETGSAVPLDRFAAPVLWKAAGPQTVADFSATCFYFARELKKTIDVPQGLIVAAWGGSRIQAWTSSEALARHGGYETELAVLRTWARDPAQALADWGRLWTRWWQAQPQVSPGERPWQAAAGSDAGWEPAPAELTAWERWNVAALADYNGMLWLRTAIELSAAQAAQDATLVLGRADEVDLSFVNGQAVGSTYGADVERRYPLPAGLLRGGTNSVVVNVLDTYKDGGLTGPHAVRAIAFADGSRVPLDGVWSWRAAPAGIAPPPRAPWHSAAGLSTLYNGMIAPIGPATVRGVVWYQGESNTFEPERYEALLGTLAGDWRARFRDPALPWLIVQLANYGPAPTAPGESGWADLRAAQQRFARADQHAGLAVTIDLGDRYDIHPPNKQELGRRLARAARHEVYGATTLPPTGPVPVAAEVALGGDVLVRFAQVTEGLRALGAPGPIGFELCTDAPGSCRWARARIVAADAVRLRVRLEGPPTRVRHAWADSPIVTLFDAAGLPAGPFELRIRDTEPGKP